MLRKLDDPNAPRLFVKRDVFDHLNIECHMLKQLAAQATDKIAPKQFYFCTQPNDVGYAYLVTEALGKDLHRLHNDLHGFTLQTTLAVVLELVSRDMLVTP